MKIYHYESFYKFYTYSEEINDRIEGQGLPASSTDICPPLEQCGENEIPIFENNEWIIVKDTFWYPEIVEVNYDAGRSMSEFQYLDLSITEFPQYPNMPQLCNSLLVVTKITQLIKIINKKFRNSLILYENHRSNHKLQLIDSPNSPNAVMQPTILYELKSELESIVFLMRRVIDSLIQLTDLTVHFSLFEERKKLSFESVGSIFNPKKADNSVVNIILGGQTYETDTTHFLPIINNLFNGFKHSLMHDETSIIIGKDFPTILGLSVEYSDHKKKIHYHNHNAYHIMMGFQENIRRIIKNQKKFITSQQTRTC